MELTHVGIRLFRSIGETPVMVNLSKKVTVLVGQNDCGKSNVLSGFQYISQTKAGTAPKFTEVDHHQRDKNRTPEVVFSGSPDHSTQRFLTALCPVTTRVHLTKNFDSGGFSEAIDPLERQALINLRRELGMGETYSQGDEKKVKKETATNLARSLANSLPDFHIVPQFRQIVNVDSYSMDGKGIIKLLSEWQHPEIGHDHLRTRFDRVEKLLRDLLDRPNVVIEVPPARKQIIVRNDKLRLPLESHGTGIHELIILAIAVLSHDNAMFGIEEPEIHLHPVLQRKFLKFLKKETSNKYIITTHSAALITPSEDVDVIHLRMSDGITTPTLISTDKQTVVALEDLGIRPSDLLQANCVIWVEGPSDRIYIKRWLEILDSSLMEGIDYSIMFYGGRLLSHLTLERDQGSSSLDTFVQLVRINQHSAIVIDSDRSSPDDAINATKTRIIEECSKSGLYSWLTDGREIENYLAANTVEAALNEQNAKGSAFNHSPFEKFDVSMSKALTKEAPASCNYTANKVIWSHRFASHIDINSIADPLKTKVDSLAKFIRTRAN